MSEYIELAPGIQCEIRINRRAKRATITVYPDARVTLTIPKVASRKPGVLFARARLPWIVQKVSKATEVGQATRPRLTRRDYLRHKETARELAHARLEHFNRWYGFAWGTVAIRNQKSRWGSCSRKGTLSFNYQIALLPQRLADYIVVHELCHLGAFDHSVRFWQLVARTVPDYKERRKELRLLVIGMR